MVVDASFCFDEDGIFLLPIEHLDSDGVSDDFAAVLAERALVSDAFRTLFDAAFHDLWQTQSRLAKASPDAYLPPRLFNVAVVLDVHAWHPYFRPFEGMSVVVYAADFEPKTSSVEHGAYQLLVAERLGQAKRASAAAFASLPYLMALDDEGARRFAEGARRTTRPDAEGARLVADLLPRLRERAFCEGIGEAPSGPGFARVRGTSLIIPRELTSDIQPVAKRLDALASEISCAHYERQAVRDLDSSSPEEALREYLVREQPMVVIATKDGDIVWDPREASALQAVSDAIAGIGAKPGRSLIADLSVLSSVTERFLGAVEGAASLPIPVHALEQGGGVYLHHERRLLAYALEQPGLSPLREAAPPYHRLLLAARAMHEWAHVAVEGGLVPVAPAKEALFGRAHADLARMFARIVNALPSEAAPLADQELRAMRDEGTRLEDLPFARLEDYRANLLARRLLRPQELHAYVRANVRSLLGEPVGTLRKLARYAYEAQYLWLAGVDDPWRYFVRSTYFLDEYVATKLLTEAVARELFGAVAQLCDCYEVDATRLVSS